MGRPCCHVSHLIRRCHCAAEMASYDVTSDELLEQDVLVTMELRRLQVHVLKQNQNLQEIFYDLESRYRDIQCCCCPCKYYPLIRMVRDASIRATRFEIVLYGALDQAALVARDNAGIASNLLQSVQNFVPNLQAVNELVLIREQLRTLSRRDLKRDLEQKQIAVDQQKRILRQTQAMISEIARLYMEAMQCGYLSRYKKLSRGVERALFNFRKYYDSDPQIL